MLNPRKTNVLPIQSTKMALSNYGDKETLIPIPTDGNLESHIDARLKLRQECAGDRTGIVDVISMLFEGNLKPGTMISDLRAKFKGIFAGVTRNRHEDAITLASGYFKGERWNTPLISNYITGSKYSFFCCDEVPFGFVSVTLDVPTKLTISLELSSHQNSLLNDFSDSHFGSQAKLDEAYRKFKERYDAQSRTNWRVWTWKDHSKTYKAWAEFGGTFDSQGVENVLLRDSLGHEITVPRGKFSEADEKSIRDGRHWESFAKTYPMRVLSMDRMAASKLEFFIPELNQTRSHQGELEKEIDKKWLGKLRTANTSKDSKRYQDWQGFAGYVR